MLVLDNNASCARPISNSCSHSVYSLIVYLLHGICETTNYSQNDEKFDRDLRLCCLKIYDLGIFKDLRLGFDVKI